MEPIVQCSTLAYRVTNPLSQSLWAIIEGYHDPLLCDYVSERGVSRTISVSPNGPLLMAVMTPLEACQMRARDRENQTLPQTWKHVHYCDGQRRKQVPFSFLGFRVYLVMLKKRGIAKVTFTAIHWHGKI